MGAGGSGGGGGAKADHQAAINSMMMERMSTDICALKKQYARIKRRQQQQAMQLYIRTGRRKINLRLSSCTVLFLFNNYCLFCSLFSRQYQLNCHFCPVDPKVCDYCTFPLLILHLNNISASKILGIRQNHTFI